MAKSLKSCGTVAQMPWYRQADIMVQSIVIGLLQVHGAACIQ